MAKPIYQYPSDDRAKGVTPTLVDGTVDANYPLTNLSNDNPGLPAKFTTDHLRLVWDLGSALSVELPVFLHWNVDSGATATWETNSSNSWPGTAVTIVATDKDGAGYRPYAWLDQSAATVRRYVSLCITGNTENLVIGGIWLGATKRSLLHNVQWGVSLPRGTEVKQQRTNMNVVHAFRRARIGGLENGTIETTDAGIAALQAWGDQCSWRLSPVPLILDPTVNEAWFVRWNQDALAPEPQSVSNSKVAVAFEHVSPGEAWP